MRSSRPLLTAVAAACLLAAGCDYLDNLLVEPSVTHARLTVQIRDAYFTQEPMESAHCEEPDRGIDFTTDRSGRFSIPDAATGSYSLHCSMPRYYYDRTVEFEVLPGGQEVTVDLPRQGGEAWYPEEEKNQVRIQNPELNIRFPRKDTLDAYPTDSNEVLRYDWRFTNQKRFSQSFENPRSTKPFLFLDADAAKTKEGPDSLILTVKARFPGIPEYIVGSDTLPIEWVRNKPPVWTSIGFNAQSVKVGCPNLNTNLGLDARATDSETDGTCASILIESMDANSAFGMVHETKRCDDPNYFKPALKSPFAKNQMKELRKTERLKITAFDDNGEHTDTILELDVFSNIVPNIEITRKLPRLDYFTNEKIEYQIIGTKADGPIENFIMDWGDGRIEKWDEISYPVDSVNTIVHYEYSDEGRFHVTGKVFDNCDESDSQSDKDTLRIRKNTSPAISLRSNAISFTNAQGTRYQVYLTVKDVDVKDKMEPLQSVTIDWGDSTEDTIPSRPTELIDSLIFHTFPNRPTENKYIIRISARDSRDAGFHSAAVPAAPLP